MGKLVDAGFGYIEGQQIKKAKYLEKRQLETAAIAKQAIGNTNAMQQREIGSRVESDAVAAMAASGGVVDSDIVADIKSTTDYNVLSELFASRSQAASLRFQAKLKKFEGRQAARMANTKFAINLAEEVVKLFAGGGAGAPQGITSTSQSSIVDFGAGTNTHFSNSNFNGLA